MEQSANQTANVIKAMRNTILFKETLVKLTNQEIDELNREIEKLKEEVPSAEQLEQSTL